MGIFDRLLGKDTALEKPVVPLEEDVKPEAVAMAIAKALAEKFEDQITRDKLTPHVGRLAITIGQKPYTIGLESYVDPLDGMAPILTRAGELLRENHDISADFAQVVDERNIPLGNVVSTHVEVTPNPLVPPEDRAVFYPPDSGKPARLTMLSPGPQNTLNPIGVDLSALNIALKIGPLS